MNDSAEAVREQIVPAALLVLAGIVAGALWRVLIPYMLDHSDLEEGMFAAEATLALVSAVGGLLTGLLVVFRPGRWVALRVSLAIGGSVVAGVLAWFTGVALSFDGFAGNAPDLTATGILLTWPVVTAVTIFAGAVLPIVSDRMNAGSPEWSRTPYQPSPLPPPAPGGQPLPGASPLPGEPPYGDQPPSYGGQPSAGGQPPTSADLPPLPPPPGTATPPPTRYP